MQIPEQIARDIIVREYGEIEITRTNVLVDGARLVELIAAGIRESQAQALPKTTERGFRVLQLSYQDYRGCEPRTFSVQKSSLATEHKLWVGPDQPEITGCGDPFSASRSHLGVNEVRQIRDALTEWLREVEA